MADELLWGDQLIAKWPDNQQGLVTAQAGREGWVSMYVALGVITHEPVQTIAAGTNVDINLALSPTYLGGQGIEMNGNGALYHDYQQYVVQPGYQRIAEMQAQFTFLSNVNTPTEFRFAVNGVPVPASDIYIEWSSQTQAMAVSMAGWAPLGIDVQDSVSVIMTKATGSVDIGAFHMSMKSYLEVSSEAAGEAYFQGKNWANE